MVGADRKTKVLSTKSILEKYEEDRVKFVRNNGEFRQFGSRLTRISRIINWKDIGLRITVGESHFNKKVN